MARKIPRLSQASGINPSQKKKGFKSSIKSPTLAKAIGFVGDRTNKAGKR